MRSTFSAAALLVSALQLAQAQTFTACNPTAKTCPSDAGLGTTLTTDFTAGKSSDWTLADGTTMTYDPTNGANFVISTSTNAPTVSSAKYIMFGKVTVSLKAAPGAGIVSSFILESDDLDEIDWEWLGTTDTSVESNFFGKGNTTTYDRAIYHPVSNAISQFHTYVIDWNAEAIKWSIDGNLVRTLSYGDALALGGKNYPQTPMVVKMGNWVGCASAAAAADPKTEGTCSWAGGPATFTNPTTMYVKSVTIEDYGCGGEYTYTDLTGSYQSIKSSGVCGAGQGSSSSSSSDSSSSVSASASISVSASESASTIASSVSSATGAILAQTSTGNGTEAQTSASAPAATGNAKTASNQTTLATATGTSGTGASPQATSSATGTGSPAQTTSNSASSMKPTHKYGKIDAIVMVLGLGLGYLVM